MEKKIENKHKTPHLLGIFLSVMYLGAYICVDEPSLFSTNKIHNFSILPPNNQGDFLAGIFAPIAFLWLVLGYFQNSTAIKLQIDELHSSIEEMKTSNVNAAEQTQLIAQNELHARRVIFFKFAERKLEEYEAYSILFAKKLRGNIYDGFHGKFVPNTGFNEGHRNKFLLIEDLIEYINSNNESFFRSDTQFLKAKDELYKCFIVFEDLQMQADLMKCDMELLLMKTPHERLYKEIYLKNIFTITISPLIK